MRPLRLKDQRFIRDTNKFNSNSRIQVRRYLVIMIANMILSMIPRIMVAMITIITKKRGILEHQNTEKIVELVTICLLRILASHIVTIQVKIIKSKK